MWVESCRFRSRLLWGMVVLAACCPFVGHAQEVGAGAATETARTPGSPEAVAPLSAVVRTHASRFALPASNAADIAHAVLPYARLSTEVYCYLRSDDTRLVAQRREEACPDDAPHARHGWHRLTVYPTDTLPPKGTSDRGLRLAVYMHDDGPDRPVQLAIAFRGTEFTSWMDWHSNLHWFLPGRDQYQVLRDIAQQVIDQSKQRAQARLKREVTDWQIVTTGHSLGGGLAQLMAYKIRDVAAAVAFDPSPVTGFYTCVEDHEVNCNVPVWRIYARGEVLAYVRALMRKGYSLSENITEVEFDGVAGNLIHKHSMPDFLALLQRADGHRPSAQWQSTGLFAADGDCMCMAQRQPGAWRAHQERCVETWRQLSPSTNDWLRAREDALYADVVQRRLGRLQLLTSPAQQVSQR